MKQVKIDFRRVSNKLAMLYSGPNKASNTAVLWKKEFKDIITPSQAERLFVAFSSEDAYLVPRSPRMFEFSQWANPCNWTAEWCENYFRKREIVKKIGGPRIPRNLIKSIENYSTEELEKELQRRKEEISVRKEYKDLKDLVCNIMEAVNATNYEDLLRIVSNIPNYVEEIKELEDAYPWLKK